MNKFLIAIGVIGSIILTSCDTDIDVNADYEDITVVYGAINPKDSTHYLKINKAFLGETSALDLANNAENFTYAADEISVVVEEYNGNNSLVKSHVVTRVTNEIPKDEGVFDNTTNVLYRFYEPNINRNNTFKLRITNASENKEITAETKIVKTIAIGTPTNTKFNFWNGTVNLEKTIGISAGADIGRVEAVLVFNYLEHYTVASGLPAVEKSIEISLGEESTKTALGSDPLEWVISGETFFDNIRSKIPANVAFLSHREIQNMDILFNVAGTELHTYMLVEAPSSSVNQEKT